MPRHEILYPRVLIVSRTQIDDRYSSGASIGKWFRDWPRSNLAHIYSTATSSTTHYCEHEYVLGGIERTFGTVFSRLKSSRVADAIKPTHDSNLTMPSRAAVLKYELSRAILAMGFWELFFLPKTSTQLESWIRDFRPDVIYSAPTDLSYLVLVLKLAARYRLPICIQIDDDWPHTRYKGSITRWPARYALKTKFRELIGKAELKLSNSAAMSREYKERYQTEFVPIMLCDDPERYRDEIGNTHFFSKPDLRIVYSGSLELDRWKSLRDLAIATANFDRKVIIDVYSYSVPQTALYGLNSLPNIRLQNGLPDRDVPAMLRSADILFLPEAFEGAHLEYIKYSISSKSHIYMMAQRPILVYGPIGAGVVRYAMEENWAFVVNQPGPDKLRSELERMINHPEECAAQLARARAVHQKNHDGKVVRQRLRDLICSAVSKSPGKERDRFKKAGV
jgi:glycosyltransferase involved in cell wall biosynthesis